MKGTGIFVTDGELEQAKVAWRCSGMFLSGGLPIGNPERLIDNFIKKYNQPNGSVLDTQTSEFCLP